MSLKLGEKVMKACAVKTLGIHSRMDQIRDVLAPQGSGDNGWCFGISLVWLMAKREWLDPTNWTHVKRTHQQQQGSNYFDLVKYLQENQPILGNGADDLLNLAGFDRLEEKTFYPDRSWGGWNYDPVESNLGSYVALYILKKAGMDLVSKTLDVSAWASGTYFMLSTGKHAMAATSNGIKSAFFDPNGGEVYWHGIGARFCLFMGEFFKNEVIRKAYLDENGGIKVTCLKAHRRQRQFGTGTGKVLDLRVRKT